MTTRNELDDKGKTEALAKLLGWRKIVSHPPTGGIEWWWAGELQENGSRLIARADYFNPLTDWRSMGLVVEAMAEKGYAREVVHFTFGRVAATFYDNDGGAFTAEAIDHNEPGAVAEAAYKALGGE